MFAKSNPRMKLLLSSVVILLLVAIFGVSLAEENQSYQPNMPWAGGCYGTYLVELPNTQAIWTLARDGTFQGTDASEASLNFDHQQGAWQRMGPKARASWLNFRYDADSSQATQYARVDAQFTFGKRCDTIDGIFDLWFYDLSEDPLDRTAGGSQIVDGDPFSGRRVTP